ncbi:MAG TPA: hypothetical protein VK689_12115 [Armatimonadota bacterium]|nr:hypothetical protein [Armatimonadota bacterium]
MSKTIQLNNQLLRRYLQSLGYSVPDAQLHLIGIRGAVPTGPDTLQLVENVPNRYNDSIGTFGTHLQMFRGSVDPGATWTENPSNPNGCAHLLNGAWRYRRGLHRGKPALVQAAPVKVWRDKDKDYARDPHEMVDTGWFGINGHAGGSAPTVDANSAGCQVTAGGWTGKPWTTYRDLVYAAPQELFWYFLVDGSDLAKFAEKGVA